MARNRKGEALSMRKIREILRLALECRIPNREIARSCSVSHATVGKYTSKVKETRLTYEELEKMEGSFIDLREDYTYGVQISVEDEAKINELKKTCKEFIDITKQIIY